MSEATEQTIAHIKQVGYYLDVVLEDLSLRSLQHDRSKLVTPEVEIFEEFTGKLKGSTYGSDEYKQFLADMKPALDHHYANNPHHPEHHHNGIYGMTLMDLMEMVSDWLAATKRHADGNVMRSIDLNEKRFEISPQLSQIFRNTVAVLEQGKKPSPVTGESR